MSNRNKMAVQILFLLRERSRHATEIAAFLFPRVSAFESYDHNAAMDKTYVMLRSLDRHGMIRQSPSIHLTEKGMHKANDLYDRTTEKQHVKSHAI